MINLPCLSSVQIMLTLVAMIYGMSFLHKLNLVVQFIMIYILVLILKLPKIPTDTYVGVVDITSSISNAEKGAASG
jgi:hypothetical protein